MSGPYLGYAAPGRKRFRDDDSPYSSPDRQFRRLNDRQRGRAPRRDDKAELSYDEVFKRNLWDAGNPSYDETKAAAFHFGRGEQGLLQLAKSVSDMWYNNNALVHTAFRIAVTELPHKIDHYAALLSVLAFEPSKDPRGGGWDDEPSEKKETGPSVASEIINDLVKLLQSNVDSRQWRSVRFQMQLFSSLASLPTKLISPASLYSLLNSFASVLDEPGVKAPRAAEFVRIVAASLFRFTIGDDHGADQLVSSLNSYVQDTRVIQPGFLVDDKNGSKIDDPLQTIVAALSRGFPLLALSAEQILRDADLEERYFSPSELPENQIELPALLVPSDDGVSTENSDIDTSPEKELYQCKGYLGIQFYPKIFEDSTVPDRFDPRGVALRAMVADIIDVFCINRKECARILLNLRSFVPPKTFTESGWSEDDDSEEKSTWILEHVIIESILSMLFASPVPRQKHVYYHTLITELCRISPSTVAPAMGKSVRRFYAGLGANEVSENSTIILDPEGIRRFVDWFALHLSNYGYQWRWKEWESDLREAEKNSPKFVFVARTLELENRLSYYDRMKSTIPESFIEEISIFPSEPSTISFEFEGEEHPHRDVAAEFIRLIKEKATMEDLKSDIETFKTKLQETGEDEETAAVLACQCLLYVGSRSLSHLLNALERYLSFFKWLVSDDRKKLLLLNVVTSLWPSSQQMLFITIDKLLQYRIVDPGTLITWIFKETEANLSITHNGDDAMQLDTNGNQENKNKSGKLMKWSNLTTWDLLKSALDRSRSRVEKLSARIRTLRKEESNRTSGDAAIKQEVKEEAATDDSPSELANAEKQVDIFAVEYKEAFVDAVRYFHSQLSSTTEPSLATSEEWWLVGWFKHFCRLYAVDIKTHKADIDKELSGLEPNEFLNNWLSQAIDWANDTT